MASLALEELHVYRLSEELADAVWTTVSGWERFARDNLGGQLVRAADSIGANIAEGYGRGTFADNKRFVRIARGSLYEVRYFLRRADSRGLVGAPEKKTIRRLLTELAPRLNAYLRSIGSRSGKEGEGIERDDRE